ncbi:MAG: YicC family protein [Candidatus Omnitrophica bacterium]|nr:YicC family protein [Candidatus Omnitrophota bacterium]
MIEGMTGFGRATAGVGSYRWTVEIRSINHRFLDCSIRLPGTFSSFEADIQKMVEACIRRGKVTVNATLANEKTSGEKLKVDLEKLKFYLKTLKTIARRHHLQGQVGIRELMMLPNLFTVEKRDFSKRYQAILKEAAQNAIKKLLTMRVIEGRLIAKDLSKRIHQIKTALHTIEARCEGSPARYQEQLTKKLESLVENLKLDPDRLAREVALQAERSDITEELVRAKHHVDSLLKAILGNGEAGRKLEFIVQEIQREVNTMSAKAQDFHISTDVVRIKSELEKIREQIQNIV